MVITELPATLADIEISLGASARGFESRERIAFACCPKESGFYFFGGGGTPMSNTELNAKLVEEFGNLERLCSQMYNEQHGVTCYIEEMKRTFVGSSRIPNWEQDLRQLKDVRHKRNKLSHGEVSFSSFCTEPEDVEFITEFRLRVMNGDDPLAQYYRVTKLLSAQKTRTVSNGNQSAYTASVSARLPHTTTLKKSSQRHVGCATYMTVFIMTLVAVAMALLLIRFS